MGKESSTFKFTRFREKVVPNRKRDVQPDIEHEERRPMDQVYVVVFVDEMSNETVAAFSNRADAESAALAVVDERAPQWDIPIDENMSSDDKLGMIDNWEMLTDGKEKLGVYDCPLNILDRSQYA
mgnify:CR=1 FL=1